MIKSVFLILSAITNIILIILLYIKTRQIQYTNMLRVGYEKKYNSFRIRYTILSKMEASNKIIQSLSQLDKPIYIYGSGIIGQKLRNIVKDNSEIKVLGFLEGKELENDKTIGENIDKNAIIIVTPIFDYDKVANLLRLYTEPHNIISIDEIL